MRHRLIGHFLVIAWWLCCGVAPAVALQPPGQEPGHIQAVQAVIQSASTAWMTGDAEGFATLFTEDGILVVPGDRWIGHSVIREVFTDFSQEHSVSVQVKKIVIQNQHAAVEWRRRETDKITGLSREADDAIFIDFVNGKIKRWREYIDWLSPEG